ncbi:MAG: phosphatase PAP2 family protein [Candidatus Syntrophosphaera sp.]|nr:phosphatase PAP2 family protein [Candidatus Syntrophosphaera sp.]
MAQHPSIKINDQDTAALRSRRIVLILDFLVPVLALGLGTWLIRIFDLDLLLQGFFFSDAGTWSGKQFALFDLVYRYGTLPALFTAFTGFAVFSVSFFSRSLVIWRWSGLFLVLAMLLGPGLLVNAVFKEYWGRPRPRNIIEFNGIHAFEEPLTYDSSSPGNSFPSGHASMGFYFFALYFVVRGRRKYLTPWFFLLAMAYGIGMGIIRMAQGGHFASDVLWAAGFVYLSCALLYHLLKLDRHSGSAQRI